MDLDRDHIRELFKALPQIMVGFRTQVAATADAHPDVAARMAPRYIDAYRRIA